MKYIDGGTIYEVEKIDYWKTLRTQAAIAAMQGMLSNPDTFNQYANNKAYGKKIGSIEKVIALASVMYADALIEQLKEELPK